MIDRDFNNYIEDMKNELNKLKTVIIANPRLKNKIDELDLDKRFYEVIYVKLVDEDKLYLTNEEGKKALFGDMEYLPFRSKRKDVNNLKLEEINEGWLIDRIK